MHDTLLALALSSLGLKASLRKWSSRKHPACWRASRSQDLPNLPAFGCAHHKIFCSPVVHEHFLDPRSCTIENRTFWHFAQWHTHPSTNAAYACTPTRVVVPLTQISPKLHLREVARFARYPGGGDRGFLDTEIFRDALAPLLSLRFRLIL